MMLHGLQAAQVTFVGQSLIHFYNYKYSRTPVIRTSKIRGVDNPDSIQAEKIRLIRRKAKISKEYRLTTSMCWQPNIPFHDSITMYCTVVRLKLLWTWYSEFKQIFLLC